MTVDLITYLFTAHSMSIMEKAMRKYCFLFVLAFAFPFLMIAVTESCSEENEENTEALVDSVQAVAIPKEAILAEKILRLKGLSNVGRVSSHIFRGGQPGPKGYETLKKMGIRTVINLRTTKSEKREVDAAGMNSIEIPISMIRSIDKKAVEKVVEIMSDPENQPVYLHCRVGQDRTGVVVAVYRMKIDGWTLEEAVAEMQEFGFNDIWLHLRYFLDEYARNL